MTGIALALDALGEGYDIVLSGGEGALMETTRQNQALLLAAHPGEFKENPAWGVGLGDIVNDHDFRAWRRRIREQIEADGQYITKLEITEKGLTLEAAYK